MFRYEWYKLWHNRKLVCFLLLLIVLNGVYFWYHAEKGDVPAHAYRKLTGELSGLNEAEAFSEIEEQKKQ